MAERERASTTYWAPSGSRTASAALGWMRAADAMKGWPPMSTDSSYTWFSRLMTRALEVLGAAIALAVPSLS